MTTPKNKPLVSIICPTYNRDGYIAEAVNSVRNQTYDNWEMIVVSDGSTDGTDRVMRYYIDNDKRIIYSKLDKNRGIAKARNHGLSLAKGSYIAVMDSDDLCSPERLEKEVAVLRSGVDFVYSHYLQADEHAKVQGGIEAPAVLTIPNVLEGFTAPHVTIMAKKKCFDEHPYQNEFKVNDDLDLILSWLKAGYKYELVPDALMIVRYHDTSVSKTHDKEIKEITEAMRRKYA